MPVALSLATWIAAENSLAGHFMSKKKPVSIDWQAIQHACSKADRPMAQIARDFGISPSTLYRKARSWRGKEASQISQRQQDHFTMVQRLLTATDQQIRHLEKQHENGQAAFDEKEARMLGTIARTLDKILDLTPNQTTPKAGNSSSKLPNGSGGHVDDRRDEAIDLDSLRKDLANRLDRLQQAGANGLSGDADGI